MVCFNAYHVMVCGILFLSNFLSYVEVCKALTCMFCEHIHCFTCEQLFYMLREEVKGDAPLTLYGYLLLLVKHNLTPT